MDEIGYIENNMGINLTQIQKMQLRSLPDYNVPMNALRPRGVNVPKRKAKSVRGRR